MKSHLKINAVSAFILGFVLCQNIRAGASFPHDRYDEPARYEGTFRQGTNAPQQAVIFLKYGRSVWPLSLFDDEESVSATIRFPKKPPIHVPLFKKINQTDIHLRDNDKNPVVGSFSGIGMQLRLPSGVFEGQFMIPGGHCGWDRGSRGLTTRQIYHFIFLPMAGLALIGALVGWIHGHRRNEKFAHSMLKGVFIAILLAPLLFLGALIALVLVVTLVARLFIGG